MDGGGGGLKRGSFCRHHVEGAHLVTAVLVAADMRDNLLVPHGCEVAFNGAHGDFSPEAVMNECGVAARILTDDFENAELSFAQQCDVFDFSHFRLVLGLEELRQMLVEHHFIGTFGGPKGGGNHLLAIGKGFRDRDDMIFCTMYLGGVVNLLYIDDNVQRDGNLLVVGGGELHRHVFLGDSCVGNGYLCPMVIKNNKYEKK